MSPYQKKLEKLLGDVQRAFDRNLPYTAKSIFRDVELVYPDLIKRYPDQGLIQRIREQLMVFEIQSG